MTSSIRHLAEKCWNYNVTQYKHNRDVFLEEGLFSVVVIAHGRHDITRKTVLGTLENINLYPGEVEWIFIENGNCDENYEFFQELDLERKVIVRQDNYGINEALNQGWALSRGEFVVVLENDWRTTISADFLTPVKDIFNEQPMVGMIQLRDPLDPNENHGSGKPYYNPWSCRPDVLERSGVNVSSHTTRNNHAYMIAKIPYGFNNNPIAIRKSVYRQCGSYPEAEVGTDPRHGETEYQERVANSNWLTAHVGLSLYSHMGRIQTVAN
jgi:glycosyltransferase involved in cell wall biosynthesis